MSQEPIIVAHRGLHRGTGLPENSIAAMTAAWRAGITWCECDVHYSADGVPFVLHDEMLDRTTSGTGPIARLQSPELAGVMLRDGGGVLTAHPLPRLDDLMAVLPDRFGLFMEIKPDTDRAIETARRWAGDRVQVLAFPAGTIQALVRGGFGGVTWTAVETESQQQAMWDYPTRGLQIRHDWADADLIREAKTRGREIGVWVVDQTEEMRRLANLGVRHFTSDDPLVLRAFAPSPSTLGKGRGEILDDRQGPHPNPLHK